MILHCCCCSLFDTDEVTLGAGRQQSFPHFSSAELVAGPTIRSFAVVSSLPVTHALQALITVRRGTEKDQLAVNTQQG